MRDIIIDTDVGDDIDDALALALALNSPELNIRGITTVFRNTDLRTQLALKLLKTFRRDDIPVARGIAKPIMEQWDTTLIPNQCALLDEEIEYNCNLHAVDFIIEEVMKQDNIVLVPIGPLTNIAAAIIKKPSIVHNTQIVMMGGMANVPYPEWNIVCDPEAAAIVFNSGIPITMVGLDVTLKCRLNEEQLNQINKSNNEQHNFLSSLIDVWMKTSGILPILHDPLALAVLIDPSLVETQDMHIKVETKGEFTRGVTVDSVNVFTGERQKPNANVCVDVDADRFIDLFLERVFNI